MKRIIEIDESLYNRIRDRMAILSDIPRLCGLVAGSEPYNPSGDCISREALKEQTIWTKVNNGVELIDIEVVPLDAIDNAQAVESRPQGEWIIDGHHIRCNKCNEYICDTDREGNKIPDNFCPNCGAKMKGRFVE